MLGEPYVSNFNNIGFLFTKFTIELIQNKVTGILWNEMVVRVWMQFVEVCLRKIFDH